MHNWAFELHFGLAYMKEIPLPSRDSAEMGLEKYGAISDVFRILENASIRKWQIPLLRSVHPLDLDCFSPIICQLYCTYIVLIVRIDGWGRRG